jgi:hypothetical protein
MRMVKITVPDYDKFRQLAESLHGLSVWYGQVSPYKYLAIGTAHGLPVAVVLPTSTFTDPTTDFPQAIAVQPPNFVIDGITA